MKDGILCINKPAGFTSFDVVAKLRGMLKLKKIGHAGTLDPMATGVLPVFLGRAAKACDCLADHDKSYRAHIQLGITTDTLDITGTVLSQQEVSVSEEDLRALLPQLTGKILQIPPMYSAVKVGGKKLYQLAREGKEVERKPRPVTIYHLSLLGRGEREHEYCLDISCSKGTYVRSLCEEIGRRLGCGAVLSGLIRTKACGFSLQDCLTFEQVEQAIHEETIEQKIFPVERVFSSYPRVDLGEHMAKLFCNGVKLDPKRVGVSEDAELYRVYTPQSGFTALAYVDEQEHFCVKKFFVL